MGRTARNRDINHPKPVEKVELSEQHVGLRFAIVAILIVVAVASFGYGIHALLSDEPGWTEIEADSAADTNISNEFVLMYNLGSRSDMNITAEKKGIIALYSDVMEQAFQLFHNNQKFEGVNNVYYINQHPNEEIVVDDMLYQAFALIQEYDNRSIYLAPIYEQYNNLFTCEDDALTVEFDPYRNDQVALEFAEMASFANDEAMVQIELLEENKICLNVSEEYLQYCEEKGITSYVDFTWMKNAFVVDYLAEKMISEGYVEATISSYDGFSRNLNEDGTAFSFNIYDYKQSSVIQVATTEFDGAKSIVSMRNFPINTLDIYRYYEYDDGQIRTSYLDVKDGLSKCAVSNLFAYADNIGCAEVLLQVAPIYISDELNIDSLLSLSDKGISNICLIDNKLLYNDKTLKLSDLYDSYTITNIE